MESKTTDIKMVRVRRLAEGAYNSDFIAISGKGEVSIPIPDSEADRMINTFPGQWEKVSDGVLSSEEKKKSETDKILSTPTGNGIAVMKFTGDCYNGDVIRMRAPGQCEVPEAEGRRLAKTFPKTWTLLEIKASPDVKSKDNKKPPVMVVEVKPPVAKPSVAPPAIKVNPDLVAKPKVETKPVPRVEDKPVPKVEPKKPDVKVAPKVQVDEKKLTRTRGRPKK